MPKVVISLDFEMRWGVHDIYGLDFDVYRKNIENVHTIVPATLNKLSERRLSATWACVGALALDGWDEYYKMNPVIPNYKDFSLAVKREYADKDPDGAQFFAPALIKEIVSTKWQELGSHSFSHIYFKEPGVTDVDFLNEMKLVERVWKDKFNLKPCSLVFPRNQSAFLEQLNKTTIRMWRGTEPTWYHASTTQIENTKISRILRLIDSVNVMTRTASQQEGSMIRSSLFLRFNLPGVLWSQHLKRIKAELRGLKKESIFHLWWHPHNLGENMSERLDRMEQVLDIIAESCVKYNITSCSMRDLI